MLDVAKLRQGKGPLLGIAALGIAIAATVAVAYIRANDEANAKPKAPGTANLGQAPGSDSYNQAYQAKFEDMVTEKLKRLDERQTDQQKAAAEQQKASLDRMEAMMQAAAARLNTASQSALSR